MSALQSQPIAHSRSMTSVLAVTWATPAGSLLWEVSSVAARCALPDGRTLDLRDGDVGDRIQSVDDERRGLRHLVVERQGIALLTLTLRLAPDRPRVLYARTPLLTSSINSGGLGLAGGRYELA